MKSKTQQLDLGRTMVDFYFLLALQNGLRLETKPFENRAADKLLEDVNESLPIVTEILSRATHDYAYVTAFGEARYSRKEHAEKMFITGNDLAVQARDSAYYAALRYNPRASLPVLLKLFKEQQWRASYGGYKWGDIVEGALLYYEQKLPPVVYVDHMIDLEHNNGCAYSKEEIRYALDLFIVEEGKQIRRFLELRKMYELLNGDDYWLSEYTIPSSKVCRYLRRFFTAVRHKPEDYFDREVKAWEVREPPTYWHYTSPNWGRKTLRIERKFFDYQSNPLDDYNFGSEYYMEQYSRMVRNFYPMNLWDSDVQIEDWVNARYSEVIRRAKLRSTRNAEAREIYLRNIERSRVHTVDVIKDRLAKYQDETKAADIVDNEITHWLDRLIDKSVDQSERREFEEGVVDKYQSLAWASAKRIINNKWPAKPGRYLNSFIIGRAREYFITHAMTRTNNRRNSFRYAKMIRERDEANRKAREERLAREEAQLKLLDEQNAKVTQAEIEAKQIKYAALTSAALKSKPTKKSKKEVVSAIYPPDETECPF